MVTGITENISKQCRLASALVVIYLLVVKAAAYEPDYYIYQPPPGSNPGLIMDVAANDNVTPATRNFLHYSQLPDNGTIGFTYPAGIGKAFYYIPNSGFVGFDTFTYNYPGCCFPPCPP